MDTETEEVLIHQNQHILDEIEKINQTFKELTDRGVLSPEFRAHVELSVELKRLERKIRVMEQAGQDVTDLKNRLRAVTLELEVLDSMPKPPLVFDFGPEVGSVTIVKKP
jgi:hypothetical protein